MRKIRYAVLGLIGVALIVIALANREFVTLQLLPGEMAGLLGFSWQISLPLFVIVLGSVLLGIGIGQLAEWIREAKHRREAKVQRKEKERLQREMVKQQKEVSPSNDDVLALLDGPSGRR